MHKLVWVGLLIGALLAGCIPIVSVRTVVITLAPPQACTLVGCVNSLRLNVQGVLPQPFDLEVNGSDGTQLISTCDLGRLAEGNATCADPRVSYDGKSITLLEMAAETVTVHLAWSGGSLEQALTPKYEWVYPNGPKCEPKCSSGQADLVIP